MKGQRKRGRQKKRWEDNIKEWTGMDFASSTRPKTGQDGKGLLRTHLWCSADLPRLWDRKQQKAYVWQCAFLENFISSEI